MSPVSAYWTADDGVGTAGCYSKETTLSSHTNRIHKLASPLPNITINSSNNSSSNNNSNLFNEHT
jgi:hypothetical protein